MTERARYLTDICGISAVYPAAISVAPKVYARRAQFVAMAVGFAGSRAVPLSGQVLVEIDHDAVPMTVSAIEPNLES